MRRLLLACAVVIVTVGATLGSVQASATSGWSIVRTPNPVSSSLHFGSLDAVSCASSSTCIAVGSGVNNRANQIAIAAKWNGTGWTALHTAQVHGAAGAGLDAVSCLSATACTAAGYEINNAGLAVPLIEQWDGSDWSVQSSPAGRGGSLAGISCTAASACTAVGATSNAAGLTVALAERWNGADWTIVPTPGIAGAPYTVLSAVSCSAATACTAVGSDTAAGFGALAERWNGSTWALEAMATPHDGEEGFVLGVACPSATSCVAAGDYINSSFSTVTLAEVWTGSTWAQQPSPSPAGGYILQMTGLSCSSVSACTAVGWTQLGPMVLRSNGSTWQLQPTPPPSGNQFVTPMLNGVSCAAASSCVSVGGFTGTMAEVWNGSKWSLSATPNAPGVLVSDLVSVSCPAAGSCFAVGNHETAAGGQAALVDSWNGSAWSTEPTPAVDGALTVILSGVSCTSPDSCVAVGWYDTPAGTQQPLAERWDGHVWSLQATPAPAGSVAASFASVSCAAPGDCVAVGSYQNTSGHQFPLVEREAGGAWSGQSTPMPPSALQGRLSSVSCTSVTSCVSVGEYLNGSANVGRGHAHQPMAVVWDGTTWAAESIARPAGAPASYLDGVSCSGPTACTAVGWFTGTAKTVTAMIEAWNGATWTMQTSGSVSDSSLAGVTCVASTECTAVGAMRDGATLAEASGGSAWTVEPTPNHDASTRQLQAVTCLSPVSCVAVGNTFGSAGYEVTLAERYIG
jgi:hypothetical protein